jgi:transglutaminase-like putative cysteine protease
MRIRIQHRMAYIYDQPISSIIQVLRLTPRNSEGQRVRNWRIDADHDVQLLNGEDAFGNIVHTLSFLRPLDDVAITVMGEVETHDTHGVVKGTMERFAPGLYLRETALTQPTAALRTFARDSAGKGEVLDRVHRVLTAVHETMTFDKALSDATTPAAKALAAKRGHAQDLAHVFIASMRVLDIPARYIGGYLARGEDIAQDGAVHGWAEAYVPKLGWIGCDPAAGISASEAHVRVAVGLDYLGAAPVRGTHQGGEEERLTVQVTADLSQQQRQN